MPSIKSFNPAKPAPAKPAPAKPAPAKPAPAVKAAPSSPAKESLAQASSSVQASSSAQASSSSSSLPPPPSDSALASHVRSQFLKVADVSALSVKQFTADLSASLGGIDLSGRKSLIKATLTDLLNAPGSTPASPSPKKKSSFPIPIPPSEHSGVYPLTVPPSLLTRSSHTGTLLVQVEEKAIKLLDLGVNTAGAIGRLSEKDGHVTLDIKGLKYDGHILPTATCMTVKVDGRNATLLAESITDEVCTLRYLEDTLLKMKESEAFRRCEEGSGDENGKGGKEKAKAKKVAKKVAKKKKPEGKKKY